MSSKTPEDIFFGEAKEKTPENIFFGSETQEQPDAVEQQPQTPKESFFDRLGKAFATQAQIAPSADVLPQLGAGAIEKLSLGGIKPPKAKTEAGQFAREVGKWGIGFPAELEALGGVINPLAWWERIIGAGLFGAGRKAVKDRFSGEEFDLKEIGKEGGLWSVFQGAGELASTVLQTKQVIDFISKTTGKTKPQVTKFLYDTFKTRFGQRFKGKPTATNVNAIMKSEPGGVAEVWSEAVQEAKETIPVKKVIEKPPVEKKPVAPVKVEVKKPIEKKVTLDGIPKVDIEKLSSIPRHMYKEQIRRIELLREGKKVDDTGWDMPSLEAVYSDLSSAHYLTSSQQKQFKILADAEKKKLIKPSVEKVPAIIVPPKIEIEKPKTKVEDFSNIKGIDLSNIYVPENEIEPSIKKFQKQEEKIITKYVSKDVYEKEYKNRAFFRQQDFWKRHEDDFSKISKEDEDAIDQLSVIDFLKDWKEDIRNFKSAFHANDGRKDKINGVITEIRGSLIAHDTPKDVALVKEAFKFLQNENYTKEDIKKSVVAVLERDLHPHDMKFVLEQLNKAAVTPVKSSVEKVPEATKVVDLFFPKEITKPPVPPKEPPKPQEPPPEKPPEDEPLRDDKINSKTSKFFSNFVSKLDVEYPFKKVDAPKTGFAVKNYFDQINKHIEQGHFVAKQIKKLGLTKDQLNNAVLQAESAIPPRDPKERQAWTMMRSYFDKALKDLQTQGVLKKGFIENIATGILAEIKALDDQIKLAKSPRIKEKLHTQQKDLLEQLKEISSFKFVSIPVRNLFSDAMKADPARVRRAVKFLNKKRRKTIRLQDLVDSGLVDKKDLTPELIIGSYSRKYGRDIALAKVINSAKREGLATLEPREGYVKIPGYVAPELARYYIHPAFADYIQAYTAPPSFSVWQKFSQQLKGWSFYNPIIVPMNDIVQQAMFTLGDPANLLKIPVNYIKAFRSLWKKDKLYWELFDKGLFSQPFVMPEKDFKDLFEWFKKGEEPIWLKVLKLPVKLHDKLYDAMSAVAWGGDRLIRITTALQMMEGGAPLEIAAQESAAFHGDYSKVPAKTRRELNKFLWTPTFKIVMGILHKNIIKNIGKITEKIFKGEKFTPKEKIRLKGLIGGLLFFGMVDLIMNSLDYKRDVFGLRYSKDILDKEGKKKTLHINFSNPANLPLKFLYRAYESATKPGQQNNLMSFIRKNKYELAIPIQIAWELFNNKTRKFDNIYEPYDSFENKLGKTANYIMKRVIPFYGLTDEEESFVSEASKEIFYKELGQFSSIIPGIFPYVTERDKVRKMRQVQSLQKRFLMKARIKAREKKPISKAEREDFKKEVERILKD